VSDDGPGNVGQRFDRLPATEAEREVEGRATRHEVVDWWTDRFDVPASLFDEYTFWEKGAGKIWALAGDVVSPIRVEAIGMKFLRTRQEHWKPTTDAVQRFGRHAQKNVIDLSEDEAEAFVAGEDQELDWDGDWGYLIAAQEIAGEREPIGVGLYVHGELRSMVPKGRQRDL
jgi:NOL1/NOP2/fmu family ribosome biogenesis protein